MSIKSQDKKLIGRAEAVRFPELDRDSMVHARIDSGARTSAIWGEAIVNASGNLDVNFFGDKKVSHTFTEYGRMAVATSTGHIDKRYTVKLLIVIKGKKIRATFTVANRKSQVYPVLIGRNVLRGKFIVDVKLGKALNAAEKKRIDSLQSKLTQEGSSI